MSPGKLQGTFPLEPGRTGGRACESGVQGRGELGMQNRNKSQAHLEK